MEQPPVLPTKVELRCDVCARAVQAKMTKKQNPRPPQGWKHYEEKYYCSACWGNRYMLRAITVPVAFPLERKSAELWEALRQCWAQATEVCNFAITELARNDYVRQPNDAKLPPMKPLYLYPLVRARNPEVTPQTVVSLLQAVERRYRKARYDVVWRSEANLPRYRYPTPYPVHNQAWKTTKTDKAGYVVHVKLNNEHWDLLLRGKYEFQRQLAAIEKIVSGKAIKGELALYRVAAHLTDHRTSGTERKEDIRSRYRIMCKIVAWLPREESKKEKQTSSILLQTTADALWVAETWTITAEREKQWIKGHKYYLQRTGQDLTKLHQQARQGDRRAQKAAERLNEERENRVTKHHNRLKTAAQTWSAMFAAHAERSLISEVKYDDSIKSYFPNFNWTQLRLALEKALDDRNISLVVVTATTTDGSTQPQ